MGLRWKRNESVKTELMKISQESALWVNYSCKIFIHILYKFPT